MKLLIFVGFVALAIVVAGLYGAVHNQISYTVAPEYFTKFKFRSFGLENPAVPERIRAAIVGVKATCWMGLPIGFLVGLAGFMHKDYRTMARASLVSLVVVVVFTLLFGLGGLLNGFIQTSSIDPADYQGWFIPEDVTGLRRYLCAGYMHNAGYLGGALSILAGFIYHFLVIRRTNPKVRE